MNEAIAKCLDTARQVAGHRDGAMAAAIAPIAPIAPELVQRRAEVRDRIAEGWVDQFFRKQIFELFDAIDEPEPRNGPLAGRCLSAYRSFVIERARGRAYRTMFHFQEPVKGGLRLAIPALRQ